MRTRDRRINTKEKVKNKDTQKRLPHERDETPDSSTTSGPRDVIRQAHDDLKRGLVDTDCRGQRGVDQVTKKG
jgi:hypothetical protein